MELLWLTYCYVVFRLFIRKAKKDPRMSDLLDAEIVPVKVEGWEDDIRIVKEIEVRDRRTKRVLYRGKERRKKRPNPYEWKRRFRFPRFWLWDWTK